MHPRKGNGLEVESPKPLHRNQKMVAGVRSKLTTWGLWNVPKHTAR